MAIEKLTLVDVEGSLRKINKTLVKCCESGCFHMESASKVANKKNGFTSLNEDNPYIATLKKLNEISVLLSLKFKQVDYEDIKNKSLKKAFIF